MGGEEELGFGIERNLILRKDNGQEADADTQLRGHKQVDAWKYFAALQAWHFSPANRGNRSMRPTLQLGRSNR